MNTDERSVATMFKNVRRLATKKLHNKIARNGLGKYAHDQAPVDFVWMMIGNQHSRGTHHPGNNGGYGNGYTNSLAGNNTQQDHVSGSTSNSKGMHADLKIVVSCKCRTCCKEGSEEKERHDLRASRHVAAYIKGPEKISDRCDVGDDPFFLRTQVN